MTQLKKKKKNGFEQCLVQLSFSLLAWEILIKTNIFHMNLLLYGTEIPGPYRPWAQAQQKGPVILRPS